MDDELAAAVLQLRADPRRARPSVRLRHTAPVRQRQSGFGDGAGRVGMATQALPVNDGLYEEVRGHRLLGFLLFLVSDSILFCSFIFGYLYIRAASPAWPPPGVERPDVFLGACNSVVLFGSGVTMHFAMEAWRHANRPRFLQW